MVYCGDFPLLRRLWGTEALLRQLWLIIERSKRKQIDIQSEQPHKFI